MVMGSGEGFRDDHPQVVGYFADIDNKDRDHGKEIDHDHQGHHFTSPTADALNTTDNNYAGDDGQDYTDDELQSINGEAQELE
jgi:hypothetical protein